MIEIEYIAVDELRGAPYNPRVMPDAQMSLLMRGIEEFGIVDPIIVNQRSGFIVGGHQRVEAARRLGLGDVPVVYVNLDDAQEKALNIALNKIHGEWDLPKLKDLLEEIDTGDLDMAVTGFTDEDLEALLTAVPPEPEAPKGDADATPEVDETRPAVTKPGDIIVMGAHRLLCGDSTNPADVARLMDGAIATLVHADPPYGMGKEKEGVANDNLYGEKLDAFQMDWWRAFRAHLVENGSAYIWGNAEDLWRLWFKGGLADSERLTLRNEIVWNKGSGQGMGTEASRMFPPATERCLFFMLGEQGFSTNSDNYWEGWEPIRAYLAGEAETMGWGPKDIKRITGVGMFSHWFTKSQWVLIPEAHYKKLQLAAEGKAFLRAWSENKAEQESLLDGHKALRQEFYGTRAHFDNTHASMTDVWDYARVVGDERHGHATPKPVAMMERAIKSSSKPGDVVIEPFGGSGTTLLACETTGRACYAMEISPAWCDVIVARWEKFTGKQAERQTTRG